jgi:hypothetical protein
MCETDVLLAGAPRAYAAVPAYPVPPLPVPPVSRAGAGLEEIVVTAQRNARAAGLRPEDVQLPVQTPQHRLEGKACVIFSLG